MFPTQGVPQRFPRPIGGMNTNTPSPVNRPTYNGASNMSTGGFAPSSGSGGFVPPTRTSPQGVGGAYGNYAQNNYGKMTSGNAAPSAGGISPTGNRRYYDQQRGDLASQYDQRSQALQGQFDKRYKSLMGMLNGYGNQQLADARQSGQNMQSSVLGDMSARGLSGTTVLDAGRMMANTNTQNNINRINEQLQNQKTGLATQLTGDALGYGERALNDYVGLGQANIRDSRNNYEDDRNFGEGQFQSDRNFGYDAYRDQRNFNRGAYEDDRNFGNRNYESDRNFDYQRQQDSQNNSWRDRTFGYQQYRDEQNRNDEWQRDRLRFMEGRNDQYPDMQSYLAMLQQYGQYY